MIARYSRKELTSIWSDENKYKIWLDVEIAAAQAMEKLGHIPKGVSSGNYMTQRGEGNHPGQGGDSGDLIIYFEESDHKLFLRDGNNILLNCWIQYPQAVFGTSIEVPTLLGKVKLKIPSGIKSGQVLRLKGKGMSELNRNHCGDQLVKINIETPKNRRN